MVLPGVHGIILIIMIITPTVPGAIVSDGVIHGITEAHIAVHTGLVTDTVFMMATMVMDTVHITTVHTTHTAHPTKIIRIIITDAEVRVQVIHLTLLLRPAQLSGKQLPPTTQELEAERKHRLLIPEKPASQLVLIQQTVPVH